MKLNFAFAFLSLIAGLLTRAQNSDHVPRPTVLEYIDAYKAIAISEMKRTGVPASITLAQGIHETEAGTSVLVRKSNNHFGIKCKAYWTGASVSHDDDAKGECFRSYPNAIDSYMDHSDFLKNGARYASLFQLDPTDYEGWAHGLRKAGYATNPKYASILIKIINNYHLQDYTLIALGKMEPEDEWLATVRPSTSPLLAEEKEVIATASIVVDEPPAVAYPEGEFKINDTRVVYAKAGTSLLSIAEKYDVAFKRLIDFNELSKESDNSLPTGQLIYLQRKRKSGANEFHIVKEGESIYDICQEEAIRLESLLEYNHLANGMQPAVGERLYLKTSAPARPALLSAKPSLASNTVVANKMVLDDYTTHVVQTKETLYAISRKYNVPIEKLKEWNKLATYDLKKGQELIIYKN